MIFFLKKWCEGHTNETNLNKVSMTVAARHSGTKCGVSAIELSHIVVAWNSISSKKLSLLCLSNIVCCRL